MCSFNSQKMTGVWLVGISRIYRIWFRRGHRTDYERRRLALMMMMMMSKTENLGAKCRVLSLGYARRAFSNHFRTRFGYHSKARTMRIRPDCVCATENDSVEPNAQFSICVCGGGAYAYCTCFVYSTNIYYY